MLLHFISMSASISTFSRQDTAKQKEKWHSIFTTYSQRAYEMPDMIGKLVKKHYSQHEEKRLREPVALNGPSEWLGEKESG